MKMGFWGSFGKPFSLGKGATSLRLKLLSSTLLYSGTGTTDWIGRPHLVDIGSTWIMAYRTGATHSPGTADRIHLRFSTNEGATWTNEDVFTDAEPCVGVPFAAHDSDGAGEGMVILCPNGNLLMHIHEQIVNKAWQYRSTDGGKNWSDEGRIDVDYGAQAYVVAGTVIYITTWASGGDGKATLYKSTNNGGGWTFVSNITDAGLSTEAGITYLGGNTLLALARDKSDGNHTWKAVSTDLGVNWTVTDIYSQVGAIHKPMLRKIGNKVYLSGRLFVNSNTQYTVMYVSSNNGATWSRPCYTPQFADTGYSDFLGRTNGNIYLLSYGGSGADASIYQYIFK